MNKTALSEIRLFSQSSREKYIKLLNHLIELRETTPHKKDVVFRPIYGALLSFPVSQQHDMLRIMAKWGILKIRHIVGILLSDETTYVVCSLDSLRKAEEYIKNLLTIAFSENKPIDKGEQSLVKDIKWPSNFKWKDNNTFDLGGKGEISFMPKQNNKTKTYFKMMADEPYRGKWIEVFKMATETGEKAHQVRVKINQIKTDKIINKGLGHLINIEPKEDYSGGAYRLVPYPKSKN